MLFFFFVSYQYSRNTCAELLRVIQFSKNANKSQITIRLYSLHNVFKGCLVNTVLIRYLDFVVIKARNTENVLFRFA